MRIASLAGFIITALSYLAFARAPTLALAGCWLALANAAGSMIWVFSTTLLQLNSEDRFRGRVFAADFALNTLAGSLSSYSLAFAVDHGVAPRTTAFVLGWVMFLPAAAWGLTLRLWRKEAPASPVL